MANFLVLVNAVKDSYSGVFVLFWVLIILSCFGIRFLENHNVQLSIRLERAIFWFLGTAMVVFVALRPIGIARDDMSYLDIYNTVCPTLTCGQLIQGTRDWVWYSIVGFLKSFIPDPRIMLWLGAAALLAKLMVVYSLVRFRLLVLLIYFSLFYEIHDLTALRVSLAIAAFMVAIWLVVQLRTYWNLWALFSCGLFHKQALVAPLILVGGVLKKSNLLLVIVCVTPIVLMLLGVYPELGRVFSNLSVEAQRIAIQNGLDDYIAAKYAGLYQGVRVAPVVVYPQILLILWLLIKARLANRWLESLMAGSLAMGCLFLWGVASIPEAQMRFFDFFMVPTVLMAGVRRLNFLEFVGVVSLSAIFVLKYNVLHHLLV